MTNGLRLFREAYKTRMLKAFLILFMLGTFGTSSLLSQVVSAGAGSYTTTLPLGASGPQATIYRTATGPVPTHKFWTAKNWYPLGEVSPNSPYHMFPQPLQAAVTPQGMSIGIHGNNDGYPANDASAIAFYQYFNADLTIGNTVVNPASVNLSDSSDWSADFNWGPSLTVRIGRGMPFAYALTDGTPTTVTFARTPTVITNNGNILAVSTPEGDSNFTNYYGLFCPTGGAWVQTGSVFTCTPPSGSNYMSVALLPGLASGSNLNATTIATQLADYAKVAFSFPTKTEVNWSYNESSSTVSTTYTVTTASMDNKSTGFLMALYPHQYDTLATAVNTPYTYLTNRGTMKVQSGTSFTTTDTYHGILPFMPPTTNYDMAKLKTLVDAVQGSTLQGDTYAQAKNFGAVAQAMPLASMADKAALTTLQTSLQNTMQTWFTATPSKASDLFYYDKNWGTLIGYPAGFGSDTSLNDHHFHYGYYIHAAAINGLFNPSWLSSSNWGGMVSLLQQDIGNYDRSNTMFPFLRHFDVYAGHSWASGTAPFIDGQNEESSSEAVNAWTGMILLGAATGDIKLRDTGIWLYTQETKSVAYYWFNGKPSFVNATAASTFPTWFAPLRVANVFDDKGDTGTFFGNNPDYEHAIEFLPFTGGSMHLGLDPNYVQANYNEDNTANGNVPKDWPDLMEMYEALSDPETAWTQWQSVTAATSGETLAHEYAWLMSLRDLGHVDATVTANTPFYAVFNKSGTKAHVAFNPTSATLNVTFSDGAMVSVPAGSMSSDSALVTSVTIGAGTTPPPPPAAPGGVTATAKSATEIDLSWTLASGVTYNVYRSTVSGFTPDGSNVVATGLSAAAYADMGLTASTTYDYVVEAVNAGGNSSPSAEVSATTSASGGGGGGTVNESNTLYLLGGATVTSQSLLTFTNGPSGTDLIPANVPQSPGTPENPLVYSVTGVSGTYNSAMSTAFDFFVDAGTNVGEAAQVEVLYDLNGTGTFDRTELYSLFATNAAIDYEDYNQSARGGLQTATGTLGNMNKGTIVIKVWSALPGPNAAPITLSVGNNPGATSSLVIPFTSVTLSQTPAVAPASLQAVAVSSSSINLSWTASPTAGVTYSLYRSKTGGFAPAPANLITSSLSGTSYADLNLDASTAYYYVVEAVNGLGNSAPSPQATATTMASTGGTPGSNTLYLVAGATGAMPSKLSFVGGQSGVDNIPANNPQSPDVPMNPLVYTITGLNAKYDSTLANTTFNMFIDAGLNVGEGAQVEVLYDLTGSGTFDRTELYHFFASDPIVGYENYTETSRGGLESATGTLSDMTNGTVVIKVWDALPGPNAAAIQLSVGNNVNALTKLVIPYNTVTQSAAGPAAPTGVMGSAVSDAEVDLSWTASTTTGVTYNIYRGSTTGFVPGTGNLLTNVSGTTYADMNVMPSTTYYYVVASTNASGTAAAAEIMVTTPAPPLLPTTTTLTLSSAAINSGTPEVLTAMVSPAAATGTVTFMDGATTLQAVVITAGQASYTAINLSVGQHMITAAYSGDATYAMSSAASQTVTVTAIPPNFAITSSPTSATISAGQSATFNLSIAPQGGFNKLLYLTCNGLPALATCSFSPQQVTLNGSTPAAVVLTVNTTGKAKASMIASNTGSLGMTPLYAAIIPFGFVAFLFGRKQRSSVLRRLLVLSCILMMATAFVACGGSKSSKPSTPAGSSTVTVTASSGGVTNTLNLTLTIQ